MMLLMGETFRAADGDVLTKLIDLGYQTGLFEAAVMGPAIDHFGKHLPQLAANFPRGRSSTSV